MAIKIVNNNLLYLENFNQLILINKLLHNTRSN